MADNKPSLIIKDIKDIYLRKNFEELKSYFNTQNQLLDFGFFEITFDKAETNKKIQHNLRFIPTDIIITGAYGSGGQFNVGLFDLSSMDITTFGPCRIRFLAGKQWTSKAAVIQKTDIISFGSTSGSAKGEAGIIKISGGIRLRENELLCDGKEYEAAAKPELAYALWDDKLKKYIHGGVGQYPNGKFNVPDLRDVFIRGKSDSRDIGSYQADAFQNIIGSHVAASFTGASSVNISSGAFFTAGYGNAAYSGGGGAGNSLLTFNFDASRVARTSDETRPKNRAFNYVIMEK
jgi:hypothetical protein